MFIDYFLPRNMLLILANGPPFAGAGFDTGAAKPAGGAACAFAPAGSNSPDPVFATAPEAEAGFVVGAPGFDDGEGPTASAPFNFVGTATRFFPRIAGCI
jgi:hypothetical protein